ncbi:MAG: type IV pilin protein [Gammaproteobacteria bacterium]
MNRLNRRRMAGVTLLELMAVVMVVGVLSIIAIPSYRQYSMRAQRTEAKTALLQLQTNQERFYLANRTYGGTADLATLGFSTGKTENGSYALTIAGNDANTYTATATPASGGRIDMTQDAMCTSLSITAQGVKSATGSNSTSCW